MNLIHRISVSLLFLFFALGLSAEFANGQVSKTESDSPTHTHVQTLVDEDVKGLVSIVGSEDGKFLYGACLGSKKLVTMSRDPKTGKVEVIDSIGDLKGAVCLAISKDQKWVVFTSCQSSLVTLYSRDAKTGKLTEVSRQQQGIEGVDGLNFPIAVTISPDSRFVYVTSPTGTGSLTTFSIKDGKLNFLQNHEGADNCLKGARLMAVDPKGEFLFVGCCKSHCLTVFDRDVKKGHLRLLNYKADGNDGCNLLEGAHGIACSKDGKHLYVSSGRWGGDHGITVFEVLQREVLEPIQELEDGEDLKNFNAGNFIKISPDGKYVYATGAKSNNVLCLERNTKSGRLKYLYDLPVDMETDLGGMMADVYISKDNRFIYAACEGEKQLFIFERKLKDKAKSNKAKEAKK